jgi:hypothetical protein
MPIRRLAAALAVAALVATIGATASAQFGSVLKGIHKGATAKPAAPAPAPKPTLECGQIDEAMLDRYLKALALRKKVYGEEVAKANASKATADALAQKRAAAMVDTMLKTDQCKDAFKEKDARSKEIARLEAAVAAASDRGDDAKAEELRKKLDPLNEALDIDADRACGGKGSAALHDCMEKKKVELAKDGGSGPMLLVQAHGACASDPSTSGMGGLTGPSEAEVAANAAYNAGMADANNKANQAEKEALGLDEHQHALFAECLLGVLNRDNEISSQMTPAVRAAIEKHEAELHGAP